MYSSTSTSWTTTATATATTLVCCVLWWNQHHRHHDWIQSEQRRRRQQRSQRIEEEKKKDDQQETLPSILAHFRELHLDYNCSVDEANQRRTAKYYELARDAHVYDLCVGIRSYARLRNRREAELNRILKYHRHNVKSDSNNKKSHRTVIVMVDDGTAKLLHQARERILEPLHYTSDVTTSSRVWIPQESIVPLQDMHVTVAIPWWWHTIRDGNRELTEELVARFRQALVVEFHHPFQLELERIVLLGGKTLVALWRCVGERRTDDGDVIHDRHGEGPDPLVQLRRDIVRCFTATDEFETFGKEPLTYAHRFPQLQQLASTPPLPALRGALKRENSIELKTPGLRYGIYSLCFIYVVLLLVCCLVGSLLYLSQLRCLPSCLLAILLCLFQFSSVTTTVSFTQPWRVSHSLA